MNNIPSSENLVKALSMLSDSSESWVSIQELSQHSNLSYESINILLCSLSIYGAFEIDLNKNRVKSISPISSDFIKCIASLISDYTKLVGDWHRQGGVESQDVFDGGVCLLHAMETRRIHLGNNSPIAKKRVINIFLKAVNKDSEGVFLLSLNDRSQAYQILGRSVQDNESEEDAAHRIIGKSLSQARLAKGKDYKLERLHDKIITSFVSPTYGAHTEFETVSYRMTSLKKAPKISPNHRWCTMSELLSGETGNHNIIPPKEIIQKYYYNILNNMDVSFSESVDNEIKKSPPKEQKTAEAPLKGESKSKDLLIATFSTIALVTCVTLLLNYASTSNMKAWIATLIIPVTCLGLVFIASTIGILNGKQLIEAAMSIVKGNSTKK